MRELLDVSKTHTSSIKSKLEKQVENKGREDNGNHAGIRSQNRKLIWRGF